ncbi:MAG: hypothetical protein HS115_01995 [Spirochaetales bacterium]|nr:hypothetical protein [Spirochaetales bacterium]
MKVRLALLAAIFIALLLFSSDSIMKLNVKLLKIDIAREQMMKYELSSRLLRYKFKRLLHHSEEMESELGLSVADSATLNHAHLTDIRPDPGIQERLAVQMVNVIRALGLKPPLRLDDDRRLLGRLQAAFYFERLKQYKRAADLYSSLIEELQRGSPEHGFALLHAGYCAALQGNVGLASARLKQVTKDHAGSHFGESAEILLEILAERGRQKVRIEAIPDAEARAREYYRSGRFQEALQTMEQLPDPPPDLTFIRARSLEESGQLEEAKNLYNTIIRSPQASPQMLKFTNRRLLLVNTIYLPDEKEAARAADRAIQLGDTATVTSVQKAVELRMAPVINGDSEDPLLGSLSQEIRANETRTAEVIPDRPPHRRLPAFSVLLVDQRLIESSRLEFRNDQALVEVDDLQMALPQLLLKELRSPHQILVTAGGTESAGTALRFEREKAYLITVDGEKEIPLSDIESVRMDPQWYEKPR